jgi:4-alpha-glucanotransferase
MPPASPDGSDRTGRSDRLGSADLNELAAAHGVSTTYDDWRGQPVHVPTATVVAVLAALGVDASTPAAVRTALESERLREWRRMLPATLVTRAGLAPAFDVHAPPGAPVEAWVELEDGSDDGSGPAAGGNGGEQRSGPARRELTEPPVWGEPRELDGRTVGVATYHLPADLPLGWHRLRARVGGVGVAEATCTLVVTPTYVGLPAAVGEERLWGFMAQLYSVRSRRSWGLGDLEDLAEIAVWSGRELGAGFVLVNPLHAADPIPPMEPSPYLPATRRFVNPVYVRPEAVPEYAYLTGPARTKAERLALLSRADNDSDALLDRDAVWEAKREVLALVHDVARSPARQGAYDGFRAREGSGLVDFATWCALAERHGLPWQRWPEELRDPRGPGVEQARRELAGRVDFHCWLQWLLDEQLAGAQRGALEAGMALGIVHDLAVGVHPDGADTWALGDVLARDVSVGAPPDAFNQQGQDWSQPPWQPERLAELGYAPYRDMLRTILRHAGGIRIDHVIGLFRLWWVPRGRPPEEGTYVRYDHEALVGILALEAWRSGALVVGEDLGTVEPWVRDYLAERGLLGTSILWFERDGEGRPLPPERWRELCLATVTTHDLPPTAGYLAGEHIRIRSELGLLTRTVEEERAVDAQEQGALMDVLSDRGLLAAEAGGAGEATGADERETVEALHRFLALTPSRLLGVALPDAVGDRRVMNQPGTSTEYPNWRLPLADGAGQPVLLEDLIGSDRARALAGAVASARSKSPANGDSSSSASRMAEYTRSTRLNSA